MNYRYATKADLPTLLRFGEQLFLVEREFDRTVTFNQDEAQDRYSQQLENPLALFVVVETDDHHAAGYLYAHIDTSETGQLPQCEIEVVYVDEQYRGQGVAPELVKRALKWVKDTDARVQIVKTHIFADNLPSRRTFEKLSFRPHNVEYQLETCP